MTSRNSVLYFGRYTPLPEIRVAMLRRAAYEVTSVSDLADAQRALERSPTMLVIMDEGITRKERAAVSPLAKRAGALVLGIHPGARDASDDVHQSSLDRPEDFMRAVSHLVLQAHGHHEIAGDLVAYVNSERRYVHVTDGVCELLGYSYQELVGRRIEDVTMPLTADTRTMFEKYLMDRGQQGTYVLRHKNGHAIPIAYKAHVLSDGCLVAEWERIAAELPKFE